MKSRKVEISQLDRQDIMHKTPDLDVVDDHDADAMEHPSCELKLGCLRRGPLILPAFDPAKEPVQKGILKQFRIAIPAVPASEVNQACASRLLPHQVLGIEWLWRKYALGQGCILGDGKYVR